MDELRKRFEDESRYFMKQFYELKTAAHLKEQKIKDSQQQALDQEIMITQNRLKNQAAFSNTNTSKKVRDMEKRMNDLTNENVETREQNERFKVEMVMMMAEAGRMQKLIAW